MKYIGLNLNRIKVFRNWALVNRTHTARASSDGIGTLHQSHTLTRLPV